MWPQKWGYNQNRLGNKARITKNTTEVLENKAYLLRKRIFYVKNVSQGVKQCFTGRETMFYYQQIYVSFFKSMFMQIAYIFTTKVSKKLFTIIGYFQEM